MEIAKDGKRNKNRDGVDQGHRCVTDTDWVEGFSAAWYLQSCGSIADKRELYSFKESINNESLKVTEEGIGLNRTPKPSGRDRNRLLKNSFRVSWDGWRGPSPTPRGNEARSTVKGNSFLR